MTREEFDYQKREAKKEGVSSDRSLEGWDSIIRRNQNIVLKGSEMEEKIIEKLLKEKGITPNKKFIKLIQKLKKCPPMVGIGVQRKGFDIQTKEEKLYLPLARAGIVNYTLARNNKIIFTLRQEIKIEIVRRLMVARKAERKSTT